MTRRKAPVPKRPKPMKRAHAPHLTWAWPSDVGVESAYTIFTLTETDRQKIIAWAKKQDATAVKMQLKSGVFKDDPMTMARLRHGLPNYGACGGAITYHFTPTSLGVVLTVTHGVTKEKLDLTDYDSW